MLDSLAAYSSTALNLTGLGPAQIRRIGQLHRRRVPPERIVTHELARQLTELSREINRQIGLLITLLLAVVAIAIVHRLYVEQPPSFHDRSGFRVIWREMDPHLKRLLAADCLARWAEGIPKVFIVLYVINILRMSPVQFGWLTSIQMIASILVYIPVAKLSDRLNRKPFILLTFAFFALFPLGLVAGANLAWLVIAFILGGLREIGEPARKALIVDLANASSRGRAVGAYYLVRGLAVFPASILGGVLWTVNPQFPFYTAFAIGAAGCILYGFLGTDKKTIAV